MNRPTHQQSMPVVSNAALAHAQSKQVGAPMAVKVQHCVMFDNASKRVPKVSK